MVQADLVVDVAMQVVEIPDNWKVRQGNLLLSDNETISVHRPV